MRETEAKSGPECCYCPTQLYGARAERGICGDCEKAIGDERMLASETEKARADLYVRAITAELELDKARRRIAALEAGLNALGDVAYPTRAAAPSDDDGRSAVALLHERARESAADAEPISQVRRFGLLLEGA